MSDISNIGGNQGIQGTSPDYANMTLDELMGVVMANRTNILDSQIRDRIMELDAKNKQLQSLNTAVSEVANAITGLENDDSVYFTDKGAQALHFANEAQALKDSGKNWMPDDMIDFFQEEGIEQGTNWIDYKEKGTAQYDARRTDSRGYDFGQGHQEWQDSINNLKAFASQQEPGAMNATIQKYAPDHYQADGSYTKQELEQIKETLKTQADNLSSTSQLEMTKLQSSMNKYNQSFELLSNFFSKYAQSLNSIIGNTR